MTPLISIILVEPETPDNIGAAARAMKNMGLFDLRCVNPPKNWKKKGRTLAVSAGDVLKNAKAFKSVTKAVADSCWVIGTTRRKGSRRGMFIAFEEALAVIKTKSLNGRVAILFGRESRGLDNRSLELCDAMMTIPSHESYPSLNLAQAVMVVVFSLFGGISAQSGPDGSGKNQELIFCRKQEMREALLHFKKALRALNYQKQPGSRLERITAVFSGIFKRSGMLEVEAQMIKGLSARIVQKGISCKS